MDREIETFLFKRYDVGNFLMKANHVKISLMFHKTKNVCT